MQNTPAQLLHMHSSLHFIITFSALLFHFSLFATVFSPFPVVYAQKMTVFSGERLSKLARYLLYYLAEPFIFSFQEVSRMKIVVSHMMSDEPMKLLRESGAEIYVAGSTDPESFFDELKDADCFINRLGEFRESVISRLPNLKVIGRHAVGYDNIDVAYATSVGIPVVFTPGANSRSVAEHAVALMFALAKDLENADPELRAGNWKVRDAGRTVRQKGRHRRDRRHRQHRGTALPRGRHADCRLQPFAQPRQSGSRRLRIL